MAKPSTCARCGAVFEGRRKYCSDECRRPPKHGPNRAAAERTVATLRKNGTIEHVDPATIAAFLSLATAVDAPDARADLWREYRAFSATLREAAAGASDDDTTAFLISIQTPRRAEVRTPADT
jgi:hypothetical protein